MKTTQASLICVAVLVLPAGCGKHEPPIDPCPSHNSTTTLPPATQCGANTFGCLVNGKVWVPEKVNSHPHTKKLHADWHDGTFVVYGSKVVDDQYVGLVWLRVEDSLATEGTYALNNWTPGLGRFEDTLCSYQTDTSWGGQLTITKFDRSNYIISGTFEFTVVATGCDTIQITEGRFDVTE